MIDISGIPDAAPLDGTELVLVIQNGVLCKAPMYEVLAVTPAAQTANVTAFTATTVSDSEIDLTWSGSGDFLLERSLDQVAWEFLYTGATAAFSDTLLLADNQYFYRVRAQDTGENPSGWEYADATTDALP